AGRHRPGLGRAGRRGCAGRRREAVRARRGLGTGAERGAPPGLPRGVDLPHRPLPRQGVGRGPADLPVRQLDAGAAVEPQLRLQRPGDDGGGVRRRGAGEVLRVGGGAARRLPEPPAAGGGAAGHGPAGVGRRGRAQRREGPPVAPGAAARPRAGGAGPVPGLLRRARRRGRQRRRDLRRGPARDRLVAVGGRALADPDRQAAAGHRHRGGGHLQGAAPHALRPLGGTTPPAEPPALPPRRRRRGHPAAADEGAGRRPGQPAGRPRGVVRLALPAPAGGVPAPAGGRDGGRPPALRSGRRRRGAVADRRAGAAQPGAGRAVPQGHLGAERGRRAGLGGGRLDRAAGRGLSGRRDRLARRPRVGNDGAVLAAIPYTTFPTIELGPLELRTFGLMVALGVLLGTWSAARNAERFGVPRDETYRVATWMVLAGIVGSRLTWAITHTESIEDPIDVIAIWEGGIQFSGGFIAALLVGLPMFRRWDRLQRWRILDGYALGLTIGLAVGRVGCFAVGEHFGRTSDFLLATRYDGGEVREP